MFGKIKTFWLKCFCLPRHNAKAAIHFAILELAHRHVAKSLTEIEPETGSTVFVIPNVLIPYASYNGKLQPI